MAASMCKSRFLGYKWAKIGIERRILYSPVTVENNKSLDNGNVAAQAFPIHEIRLLENDHRYIYLTTDPRPTCLTGMMPLIYLGIDETNSGLRMSSNCAISNGQEMCRVSSVTNRSKKVLGSLRLLNHVPCRSMSTRYRQSLYSRTCQFSNCNLNFRSYSNDVEPNKKVVMHLMDIPEIIWPSIIKSLRNWVLANLIITPYFDKEFNLPDFIRGSKKALDFVSGCFSTGDYEKLEGLVANDAIQEVKQNIASFSLQQREELHINEKDIYFSFPYQIGVMFSDDDSNQKRFVEITMCYHVLQGWDELKKQGTSPPLNMGMMPEYNRKIHMCNYRFIKEFTKGVEGEWTINALNHFKPSDYVS